MKNFSFLIYAYQGVLAAAKTYLLGMLDGVDAVLLVNSAQQVGGVVLCRHLLVIDDVDARLVEGNGVCGGEDAVVLQLHGFGMIDAVAVN